jgi:hypothetical protein
MRDERERWDWREEEEFEDRGFRTFEFRVAPVALFPPVSTVSTVSLESGIGDCNRSAHK